jgi:hypothetical protein
VSALRGSVDDGGTSRIFLGTSSSVSLDCFADVFASSVWAAAEITGAAS